MSDSTELKEDIDDLTELQKIVILLLTCEEKHYSSELAKFFTLFEEKSISSNFTHYKGFLYLLTRLSIYFNVNNEKRQFIFLDILKVLILKYSLGETFQQSDLFSIFKYNKHFILFLYKEEILDISFIETKISLGNDMHFFLFFIPEIQRINPQLYEMQKKNFGLTEEQIDILYNRNTGNNQCLLEDRKNIREFWHSNEIMAQIIRKDDLDSFIHLIAQNKGYFLNSNIKPSFLENNTKINNWCGISLLEYSMAFASIKIFRYLWLKKARYSQISIKYSIIGGNYEIIHILDEESKYKFNEECYSISIHYCRQEISEYLLNYFENKQF
ncbi:hypothetical protein TRFO_21962 [Tritrichomonas foetus]|uniref:DUF3447 domain-containing protein n=1 Tax=Tritrichomonas foetus TaxID=1144522 RepID=A0A1J4KCR9_9EUKA|nr:hypothetical protein TRFO_21962 [Tritrichomonas foetus]|eukprot:OHT09223.1 hypothetical protein TRFO_21962 [Tritrichomonas foetus]